MRCAALWLVVAAACASASGCRPGSVPPLVFASEIEADYRLLPLGEQRNTFTGMGTRIFLGHRVDRFRIKLRLVNPAHPAEWIPGVVLTVSPDHGSPLQLTVLPGTHDPDGAFWLPQMTENSAAIRLSASGLVDLGVGQPHLDLVQVERHFRAGSAVDDVPVVASPSPPGGGFASVHYDEVVTVSPAIGEAQHFRVSPGGASTESIYISPLLRSMNNSTGLRVHISSTGFVAPTNTSVTWQEALPGDTGFYAEFQPVPGQSVFVTVVNAVITPYLFAHAGLVQRFEGVVIEREANMRGAPDISVDGLRATVDREHPFNAQLADYLEPRADFDRRIRESLAIASAVSLDATSGQMRFRSAELHRQSDPFRDSDIHFSACGSVTDPACRANAGPFHIDMFTADLADPVQGGATLVHEWGHFDYGLPDEYTDVQGLPHLLTSVALDTNCIMGTSHTVEFCTPMNHLGSSDESCWAEIAEEYPGVDSRALNPGTLRGARYLDVLHRLDSLLTITPR